MKVEWKPVARLDFYKEYHYVCLTLLPEMKSNKSNHTAFDFLRNVQSWAC